MTKKDKLLEKFLNQPQSLKYNEIEGILFDLGFTRREGKGSHVRFYQPFFKIKFVFPLHHGDCDKIYKQKIHKIITQYFL